MQRAILILTMFFALAACNKKDAEKPAEEKPAGILVETEEAKRGEFVKVRNYVGNVAAYKSVLVVPLISDRILEFPVENGVFVNKGDVIAVIRHEMSKSGIRQIDAQISNVRFQMKAAQRELERVESMRAEQLVTEQNVDKARDAVEGMKYQLQQLNAAKDQSRVGLNNSTVSAPIGGYVSNKRGEAGSVASPSMPLCEILDVSKLKVMVNIPEADSGNLKIGAEVRLSFDAFPGESVRATISRIMPYVNMATRTVRIEATFDNVYNEASKMYRYKPGMYATVTMELLRRPDTLTVSRRALLFGEDLPADGAKVFRKAFVAKGNKAEERIVEIGENEGFNVVVLDGIEDGEKVIVRGHHRLADKEEIREVKKRTASTSGASAVVPEPGQAKADSVSSEKADNVLSEKADNVLSEKADNVPSEKADNVSSEKADNVPSEKATEKAKTSEASASGEAKSSS